MPQRTLVITGGAGFIGSAVIRRLIRETDYSVINLDNLTYAGNLENLAEVSASSRYRFIRADICDLQGMHKVMEQCRPDAVMHLAAESHVDRSIDAPAEFIQTNLVGTYNLLVSALSYWRKLDAERQRRFRFHHISTDEVYGSLGVTGSFTEHTAYAPNSPYSASKAGADHLVRAWHRTYGLPVVTSNCSNNYGPNQFPEKLIPHIIINALKGKPLPVYGDGAHVRDWIFVDDHARALQIILEQGEVGQVYNVGGNNECTNLEVVRTICSLLDEMLPESQYRPHHELIQFVPDRPGHDYRYAINAAKIRSELDWLPLETFETGMRKTVQWYLGNRGWWQRVTDGSYRLTRLGLEEELA